MIKNIFYANFRKVLKTDMGCIKLVCDGIKYLNIKKKCCVQRLFVMTYITLQ